MEHKDDTFENPILKKILESEIHDVDSIIVLQGLSGAVIGISERWGEIPKLVYDKDRYLDGDKYGQSTRGQHVLVLKHPIGGVEVMTD